MSLIEQLVEKSESLKPEVKERYPYLQDSNHVQAVTNYIALSVRIGLIHSALIRAESSFVIPDLRSELQELVDMRNKLLESDDYQVAHQAIESHRTQPTEGES